ncbi:hypothetical protein BO85DRAFT_158765 [Aspergillus piperis CBS 112811]|uniref:Uncharacterized protein n=1 Tax=Aspergillus piperis CBS 112811 TaxID=1448313 RepID=A0A8G1QT89_9EURO|nr:hypothetical protein BO85DRAFT_158765 [Aspergillus piperis CBS 112811]RAH53162.1 hypothetical protein BO85DRAFT_158765 [Aspergillus piperis CBS 112811]
MILEIRRELIVETMALGSWGMGAWLEPGKWLPQAENVGDMPLGIAPRRRGTCGDLSYRSGSNGYAQRCGEVKSSHSSPSLGCCCGRILGYWFPTRTNLGFTHGPSSSKEIPFIAKLMSSAISLTVCRGDRDNDRWTLIFLS